MSEVKVKLEKGHTDYRIEQIRGAITIGVATKEFRVNEWLTEAEAKIAAENYDVTVVPKS